MKIKPAFNGGTINIPSTSWLGYSALFIDIVGGEALPKMRGNLPSVEFGVTILSWLLMASSKVRWFTLVWPRAQEVRHQSLTC